MLWYRPNIKVIWLCYGCFVINVMVIFVMFMLWLCYSYVYVIIMFKPMLCIFHPGPQVHFALSLLYL